jgi:uncharacterized protein (DUF983 family)
MVLSEYAVNRPRRPELLGRGLRRRCPLCGSGHLFRLWVAMVDRCPRCDLRFERVEGHWIGAIGLNTVVSFAVLLVVVAGGTALTVPDIPAIPLTSAALATAVIVPVAFQPVSRTLWTAIDLAVRPVEADELS